MSDMVEKVNEMMDSMTDEDWIDSRAEREAEKAERNREKYGENWEEVLEDIRKRREAPIEENQDQNQYFLMQKSRLQQEKRSLQKRLDHLNDEMIAWAEERTGLRLYERVSLEYNDGGGIISGFEIKPNGVILIKVRYQFSSGMYHPDAVTETHGIVENAEKYV